MFGIIIDSTKNAAKIYRTSDTIIKNLLSDSSSFIEIRDYETHFKILVGTWKELPDGEWLDNDEEGVNWYLDNDGNHWHSTDEGYCMWDESQ